MIGIKTIIALGKIAVCALSSWCIWQDANKKDMYRLVRDVGCGIIEMLLLNQCPNGYF